MRSKKFETKEEWLEARRGKITGSRLKDIFVKRGTSEKIGYYEIIAERIAEKAEEENPMERGIRLEEEALQKFQEKTGKKFDNSLVIWEHEENPSIAISPDAFNKNEAVEIKCLSSARHIEAKLTGQYPKDYYEQVMQYFIVNEQLQTLHFVMYDPRMPENLQLVVFEINRENIQEEIEELYQYQTRKLEEINKIVIELTF